MIYGVKELNKGSTYLQLASHSENLRLFFSPISLLLFARERLQKYFFYCTSLKVFTDNELPK